MPYKTPTYLRESGTSADKLPKRVREQHEDLRLLTEDFKDESCPEYTETDDHLFLAVKEPRKRVFGGHGQKRGPAVRP